MVGAADNLVLAMLILFGVTVNEPNVSLNIPSRQLERYFHFPRTSAVMFGLILKELNKADRG